MRTVRVEWRGVYVAYIREDLVRLGLLVGYRFSAGAKGARNAVPPSFDVDAFCRQHKLDVKQVHVHHDRGEGKSYVSVRGQAVALRLMRESAAAVDSLRL